MYILKKLNSLMWHDGQWIIYKCSYHEHWAFFLSWWFLKCNSPKTYFMVLYKKGNSIFTCHNHKRKRVILTDNLTPQFVVFFPSFLYICVLSANDIIVLIDIWYMHNLCDEKLEVIIIVVWIPKSIVTLKYNGQWHYKSCSIISYFFVKLN